MSIYCCSDLHANYNIWKQIKDYLKPEDKLINLGDTIDRGSCGLEILTQNLNMPKVTLLKGNHEDFIDIIGTSFYNEGYYKLYDLSLWFQNGGEKTYEAFNELSTKNKHILIEKIRKLPTHLEYTNKKGEILYLCHAGRQPDTTEFSNNYIWDRHHISDKNWRGKNNEYCIHGHTPVCYMKYYINQNEKIPENYFKIFKYCGGHKINIDLGTFNTHTACLLNLDTWEEIYFKDNGIN